MKLNKYTLGLIATSTLALSVNAQNTKKVWKTFWLEDGSANRTGSFYSLESPITGDEGNRVIAFTPAGGQYQNINSMVNLTPYVGLPMRIIFDIYLTPDQKANPEIADDQLYFSCKNANVGQTGTTDVGWGWTTVGSFKSGWTRDYTINASVLFLLEMILQGVRFYF